MRDLVGLGALLRFHARRDRWMLLWWIVGIVVLYWSQAVSVDATYATQAELSRAAATMADNPALVAMTGPARALDTVGGQVASQAMAFGAIVAGLMSMFLVGRHLRAEEESGRDELVRSAAIGRLAPVAATGALVAAADVAVGMLVTLSLLAYGLTAAGSVAIGLALTLTALVFAASALVAVQLAGTTRGAYGLVGAVMAASYALRAAGDVGDGTASWFSPIGWGQAMHPYSGERWWPALLPVAVTALLLLVARSLFQRRDIGSGLLAARPGPARASRRLGTASGLAWRLQRGSVLGWSLGLFLMGLAYGSLGDDVGDLLGDSATSREMFGIAGGDVTDAFYATAASMLAVLAAAFAVSSMLRVRGEEADGHAEVLLATALPRWRWLAGHVVVTTVASLLVVSAAGLGLGCGYALVTGRSGEMWPLLGAVLPQVLPVLVLVGVTTLALGVRSRWGLLGWAAFGFCVVVVFFGEVLRLPDTVLDVSPFAHLARVPLEDFRVAPAVGLALVAVALVGGGVALLVRRDVVSN